MRLTPSNGPGSRRGALVNALAFKLLFETTPVIRRRFPQCQYFYLPSRSLHAGSLHIARRGSTRFGRYGSNELNTTVRP